jgi:hypothetical protein
LVAYTVESALGHDCSSLHQEDTSGFYSSYMIHAREDGILKELRYSDEIRENIVEQSIYFKPGQKVGRFNGSHETIGTMILKFSNMEDMLCKMDNMEDFFKVLVD